MTEEKKEIPQKRPQRGKLMPPWKPGQVVNPKGRGKGVRNFKTIFEAAAREVAEALKLGKKPNAVQIELVKRGIKMGLGGSYQFYKDLMDRLYGQAKQPIEHELVGDVIINITNSEVAKAKERIKGKK